MIHLRIIAPADRSEQVHDLLCGLESVVNVVFLKGVAARPAGDLILCDVAREDASVVIADLKELDVHRDGSIALETIDTDISAAAERAEAHAEGAAADAVVWEEVEERTSENVELSGVFLVFMVLAAFIASAGIFLDSEVLIVGAMVVGPEFGPIAGFCVAFVNRRPDVARRSLLALAVGFPLAIAATALAALVFRATGVTPREFSAEDHQIARVISEPDFFTVFVALCAGAAGMLSLSTAKSGALIGVLISVTTIPAAANIGVTAAYGDWDAWRGSLAQLGLNLTFILLAGTGVLLVQRLLYARRHRHHLEERRRGRARPAASRGSSPERPRAGSR